MKNIIFSILITLLTNFSAHAQSTRIHGSCITSGINSENNRIRITITENGFEKKDLIPIEDDGTFNYDFTLNSTKEVVLSYLNIKARILIRPNDIIQIKFIDSIGKYLIESDCLPATKNLLIYTKEIETLGTMVTPSMSGKAKPLSVDAYKKLRYKEYLNQLNSLNALLIKEDISDSLFRKLVSSDLLYMYYYDLSIFPFVGTHKLDLSDNPFEYFDFLKTGVHISSTPKIVTSAYNTFISFLESSVEIICNRQSKLPTVQKDTATSNKPMQMQYLQRIIENFSTYSFYEDVVSILLKRNYQAIVEANMEDVVIVQCKTILPQSRIEEIVQMHASNQKKNLFDYLKTVGGKSNKFTRVLEFIKDRNSKPIFLDFWFTNCPPCIAEFPYYNKYVKKYQGKVEFVFVGVHMDSKEWSNAIKKYNLPGSHILLTQTEMSALEIFFSLQGYPHHSLLEVGGNLNTNLLKDYSFKHDSLLIEKIINDLLK